MSFLKDPTEKAAEDLLKKFGSFIKNYKQTLSQQIFTKSDQKSIFQLYYGHDTENISINQLFECDNKLLSKILIVFHHLGNEMKRLDSASEKIIEKLTLIEEEITVSISDGDLSQEEATNNAVVKFSYALEDLLNMKFLIQNSISLSRNLIQQISALYAMEKHFHITPSSCFPSHFDDLGLVFKNLMLFDSVFQNSNYKEYLRLYGELIERQQGQMDDDLIRNLQNTLHELDLLLDGNIFQIGIDNLIALKGKIKPKVLKKLENSLMVYIKNLMNSINMFETNISELMETNEIVKLNVFIVIYQNMFGNFDAKCMRLASEINNKFCAITLYNTLWNGNEYLKKMVPAIFKFNFDIRKMQLNMLSQKVQSLNKETMTYASQVSIKQPFFTMQYLIFLYCIILDIIMDNSYAKRITTWKRKRDRKMS